MRKARFTEHQIIAVLKSAESEEQKLLLNTNNLKEESHLKGLLQKLWGFSRVAHRIDSPFLVWSDNINPLKKVELA